MTEEIRKVHLWRRFFARKIDYILFFVVIGIPLIFMYPSIGESKNSFVPLLIIFAWVFVEAPLLSLWGATPGKWLLEIKVRNADGSKLSFSQALDRSLSVWLKGIGIGLPPFTLITAAIAARKLERDRITSWDKEGGFEVIHSRLIPIKISLASLIIVGAILLYTYS